MVSHITIMKGTKNTVEVLILIVVDDGLVQSKMYVHLQTLRVVLILVVVDDGLVPFTDDTSVSATEQPSLNPCCSGRWSRTMRGIAASKAVVVLILVVVDDGLVLKIGELYYE